MTETYPLRMSSRQRRRATGYVLVLGAAMLLTVIGYAAIVSARTRTEMVVGTNDWSEAGVLAIAAIEDAPVILANNSNWRATITSGTEIGEQNLGRGVASIIFVDEDDGDFTTGIYSPVRAYGIGRVGEAVRVRSVLLSPNANTPLSCLEVSAHCASEFNLLAAKFTTDQIVSTGDAVNGVFSQLDGDVEALYAGGGVTINGTVTHDVTPRDVPDPEAVFEYYVANGTEIPLGALPVLSMPTIENAVLTPTYNSITGEVNAQGIYVVDCQSQTIDIRNSRIQGTIVLLNARDTDGNPDCQVTGKVSWEPAIPNYPALLVDGDLQLNFDGSSTMDEADLGVSFNPIGAPYGGDEDSKSDDSYPSRIKGLVYARTWLCFEANTPTVNGVIVAGVSILTAFAEASVTYDNRYYRDPPPGFGTGPLEPVPGTWRWDALP